MIKPSNCQPNVKDRLPLSAIITPANASGNTIPFFLDPDYTWEVIEVNFLVTTNYIVSQAATLTLGYLGALTEFFATASLGTAAVAAGGIINIPLSYSPTYGSGGPVLLPKGKALVAGWTQKSAQSGAGYLSVRLRPIDVKYLSSKRPGGAAQATA